MERQKYCTQSRSFEMEEVAKITDKVVDVIGSGDILELSWNLYQQNKRSWRVVLGESMLKKGGGVFVNHNNAVTVGAQFPATNLEFLTSRG